MIYEQCVVADLNSTYIIYVMANAYLTFSDLVVTCSSRTQTASAPIPLQSGIPSKPFSLIGGQRQIFQMPLTISNGVILCAVHAKNGDADLYIRLGAEPDLILGQHDCASETTESDKQCEVHQTVKLSTTVYANVVAFSTFDNATLSCTPVNTTNEGEATEAPGSGPAGPPSQPSSPGSHSQAGSPSCPRPQTVTSSNDDIKSSSNDESKSSSYDGTKSSSNDDTTSSSDDNAKSSSKDNKKSSKHGTKSSSDDEIEGISSNDNNVPVALDQEHSPSISKASDQALRTYASLKLTVAGMLISFAATAHIFT